MPKFLKGLAALNALMYLVLCAFQLHCCLGISYQGKTQCRPVPLNRPSGMWKMPLPVTLPSPSVTVSVVSGASVAKTPVPVHVPWPLNVPFVTTKFDELLDGSDVKVPSYSVMLSLIHCPSHIADVHAFLVWGTSLASLVSNSKKQQCKVEP